MTFHDGQARELYDLPDAPRPDPDAAAPVRFLPEYDNILLGHLDRTRVMNVEHKTPLFPGNGRVLGSVLVDGRFAGGWKVVRAQRQAILEVDLVVPATGADRRALEDEARRLLAFVTPDLDRHDVKVASPTVAGRR